MGGTGSGGHNRLSDAEKKRKGTFRKDQSEKVYAKQAATKVVAGPWIKKIPDPTLPLPPRAAELYRKYAQMLLDQKRLTQLMAEKCQSTALRTMAIEEALKAGKVPSASMIKDRDKDLEKLIIAEAADPAAGGPQGRSRFAGVGFTQDRAAKITVRRSAAAGHRR